MSEMIKKDRGIPRRLQMLEALKRRLPATHPKWYFVEKDCMKSYAGYRGEVAADYHLQFLPKGKYHILLDLRIPVGEHFM
mgnify:CR=1 FL=1